MELQDIISKIEIWQEWHDNYCHFVPKFIESAKSCENWKDWNKDLFHEFFERGGDQCVSSLQQGYFTKEEQVKIKEDWNELAPMLKNIAESQDEPLWDIYDKIKSFLRERTNQDRKAATNRLIASLQPNLLCTIVQESCLKETFNRMRDAGLKDVPEFDSYSWFKSSYLLLAYFKDKLKSYSAYDICTYPWQVREYLINLSKKQIHCMENIQSYINLLKANKNLVLTGAPGTGKTFLAKEIAKAMDAEVEFVQFHPSYDYTDFVEGLRPKNDNGNIGFERKDGVFKEFCKEALNNQSSNFVFIIDEINRGEISKIFGELFFSVDSGYRGEKGKVQTQYANLIEDGDEFKDGFYIPENVYIIGTMNDIDRSVESMDFAMRRRFTWKEIKAEDTQETILNDLENLKDETIKRMNNLNKVIRNKETNLSEAYCIGAAYFKKIKDYEGDFNKLWDNHLEGLLFEYTRGMQNQETILKELKNAYDLKDNLINDNSNQD